MLYDAYVDGAFSPAVTRAMAESIYDEYGIRLFGTDNGNDGWEEVSKKKSTPKKRSSRKKSEVSDDEKNEMYAVSFWRAADRVEHVDPYR